MGATFTIKLVDLIESEFDFGLTADDYPIFDETYRTNLNKKILDHYYNYEIGQETESMFKFALNRKLREIMPLYNQYYSSAQLEIDPLLSMKYSDIADVVDHLASSSTNANTANSTQNSDTNSKARAVHSETPQVQLSASEDYASSANDSVSDATVTSSNDSTGNETGSSTNDRTNNVTRNVQGYNIPTAQLLQLFRSTFLNIDMMVIGELQTLFMQVWDNGDEFSGTEGFTYYGYF